VGEQQEGKPKEKGGGLSSGSDRQEVGGRVSTQRDPQTSFVKSELKALLVETTKNGAPPGGSRGERLRKLWVGKVEENRQRRGLGHGSDLRTVGVTESDGSSQKDIWTTNFWKRQKGGKRKKTPISESPSTERKSTRIRGKGGIAQGRRGKKGR